MRQEIAGDDGPQVVQRLALSRCINDSLSEIRAAAAGGESRATVFAAIDRYYTPRHTWDSVAFQTAASSGVWSRLPPETMGRLS
jgi:hypothetical protein